MSDDSSCLFFDEVRKHTVTVVQTLEGQVEEKHTWTAAARDRVALATGCKVVIRARDKKKGPRQMMVTGPACTVELARRMALGTVTGPWVSIISSSAGILLWFSKKQTAPKHMGLVPKSRISLRNRDSK